MKSLLTSRQRKAIRTAGDKCGNVPVSKLEILACMLAVGRRGYHASELVNPDGRMQAKWPHEKGKP